MSKFLTSMILAMVCTAHALTEAEFEALYKRTDKDADACYKLYQAYRDGDGVEKNETCARKWLLGAHLNGMPVYNEIANLPWRKKAKLKPGRQLTPRFSQETIREKNEEMKLVAEGDHPELLEIVNIDLNKISTKNRAKLYGDTRYKLARKLLSDGADPNCPIKNGYSAMSRFMESDASYQKFGNMFLEAGGDLHSRDSAGIAIGLKYNGPDEDIKLNPKIKKRKLEADKAHAAKVAYLLKNGMDVRMIDTTGATMLCIACMVGNSQTVELLCAAGADPNQKCSQYEIAFPAKTVTYRNSLIGIVDGNTPLMFCITGAKVKLLQTLLRCGADPELANDKGVKPLAYARDMLAKADSDEYREKLEKVVAILEDAIAKGTASSDSAGASTTGKKKKKKKKN